MLGILTTKQNTMISVYKQGISWTVSATLFHRAIQDDYVSPQELHKILIETEKHRQLKAEIQT